MKLFFFTLLGHKPQLRSLFKCCCLMLPCKGGQHFSSPKNIPGTAVYGEINRKWWRWNQGHLGLLVHSWKIYAIKNLHRAAFYARLCGLILPVLRLGINVVRNDLRLFQHDARRHATIVQSSPREERRASNAAFPQRDKPYSRNLTSIPVATSV